MGSARVSATAFTLACLCALAGAQERFPFLFDISPVFWGCDVGVGYRGLALVSGLDTVFWVYGGGGYEQMTYQRYPDGSLVTGALPSGLDPSTAPFYERWSARWQAGIEQGILWNPKLQSNLLDAFVFYRGRVDRNDLSDRTQLISLSSLPDKAGITQNSFLVGLNYNDISLDLRSKVQSGLYGEVTAEWVPPSLNAIGDAVRFNATVKGFLPLFDAAPEADTNLFSVYAGDFLSADYAMGPSVPLNIRQTIGGLEPRVGLGYAVRGVDDGSMDTNLKVVNNMEVRANLPALLYRDIVPGVLCYVDTGYYDQVGETVANPLSGVVASVGVGAFLDVLDLSSVTGYVNCRLTGTGDDGSRLHVSVEFSAKF